MVCVLLLSGVVTITNYPCFYCQLPLFLFPITPVFVSNYPCFFSNNSYSRCRYLVCTLSHAWCPPVANRRGSRAIHPGKAPQGTGQSIVLYTRSLCSLLTFPIDPLIPSHSFDCSSSRVPLLSHLFLRLCLVSCIRDAAAAAPIVLHFLIVLALVFLPFRLRNCFRLLLKRGRSRECTH